MFRTKPLVKPSPPSAGAAGLSFFNVFFIGISCVIGTGIYFGPITSYAESGPASLMALFISGILCLSVALPYAELSTRVQGFNYEYLSVTCGEFLSLFYTFGIILVNIFFTAIASQLWSSFFIQLTGLNLDGKHLQAVAVIAVSILILTGSRSSAIFSNVSTIINLLNAVLAGALLWYQPQFTFPTNKLWDAFSNFDKARLAFPIWFFTFLGFENVGAIASNAKNPSKSIPISMIGTVLIAIILNLIIFIGVMGQNGDTSKTSVLDVIYWKELRGVMSLGALFGVTSSLMWTTILQGEMIQTLSKDGLIPTFFNKRNKCGSPYIATVLHTILSLVCCYYGSISGLISTLGWTIIGLALGCLGLIFIQFDNTPEFPTQQDKLKKYGLVFGIVFIFIGAVGEFPSLMLLSMWQVRAALALVTLSGYLYLLMKSKITAEKSPVPCIGFPYVPLIASMCLFFVVGYTMHFTSFLSVLATTFVIYFLYSSRHSTLNTGAARYGPLKCINELA